MNSYLTVRGNDTSEISDEYYLLEYSDWTYDSMDNTFNNVGKMKDKPQNMVVMKDGMITKYHFKDTIGMQFGLNYISKEEKQKITEAYHK